MTWFAVERVVHAQFLFMICSRVTTHEIIVCYDGDLTVVRQLRKLGGDIDFAGSIRGGINGVLNFELWCDGGFGSNGSIDCDHMIRVVSRMAKNHEHGTRGFKIKTHLGASIL